MRIHSKSAAALVLAVASLSVHATSAPIVPPTNRWQVSTKPRGRKPGGNGQRPLTMPKAPLQTRQASSAVPSNPAPSGSWPAHTEPDAPSGFARFQKASTCSFH